MNGVNKYIKLGDLVKEGKGKIHTGPFGSQLHASDYVQSGIPCIMPANMLNNYLDLSEIAYINEIDASRLSKYLVEEGDIVYSRRGDVTQKALIRSFESGYFCGTGCLLIRPGIHIDSNYLLYYLSLKELKTWIKKQAVGATMPNLNTGILSDIPFKFIELEKQIAVASILRTLDKKIELNNRINTELEAMAKTLYDYWFVQFDFPDEHGKPYKSSGGKMVYNETLKRDIPEGWGVKKWGELITIESGYPFKSSDYTDNGRYKVITIKNVQDGELILDKCDTINFIPTNLSEKCYLSLGDILISLTGNVGRICVVHCEELLLNQRVGKISCDNVYKNYVYRYFTMSSTHDWLKRVSNGSAQQNLSPNDIIKGNCLIPNLNVIEKFNRLHQPIYIKRHLASLNNQKLTELRDWLLPMLMNGQVTVK